MKADFRFGDRLLDFVDIVFPASRLTQSVQEGFKQTCRFAASELTACIGPNHPLYHPESRQQFVMCFLQISAALCLPQGWQKALKNFLQQRLDIIPTTTSLHKATRKMDHIDFYLNTFITFIPDLSLVKSGR